MIEGVDPETIVVNNNASGLIARVTGTNKYRVYGTDPIARVHEFRSPKKWPDNWRFQLSPNRRFPLGPNLRRTVVLSMKGESLYDLKRDRLVIGGLEDGFRYLFGTKAYSDNGEFLYITSKTWLESKPNLIRQISVKTGELTAKAQIEFPSLEKPRTWVVDIDELILGPSLKFALSGDTSPRIDKKTVWVFDARDWMGDGHVRLRPIHTLLWDDEKPNERHSRYRYPFPHTVKFNSQGSLLLIGGHSKTKVVDVNSGELADDYVSDEECVAMAISPDNTRILSLGFYGLTLRELGSSRILPRIKSLPWDAWRLRAQWDSESSNGMKCDLFVINREWTKCIAKEESSFGVFFNGKPIAFTMHTWQIDQPIVAVD